MTQTATTKAVEITQIKQMLRISLKHPPLLITAVIVFLNFIAYVRVYICISIHVAKLYMMRPALNEANRRQHQQRP